MSLVWIITLALIAGPDGRQDAPRRDAGAPTASPAARPGSAKPACLASIVRGSAHRPYSAPWSPTGLDEFDTEEVDETWIIQLDALAVFPSSWLRPAPPGPRPRPRPTGRTSRPARDSIPLRC